MLTPQEKLSYREQPEYKPEDCCEEWLREFGRYLLHETEGGRLLCQECYNHYLEEEEND